MSNTLLTPALARCRRLFLRNHVVDINIGAHAFEPLALLLDQKFYRVPRVIRAQEELDAVEPVHREGQRDGTRQPNLAALGWKAIGQVCDGRLAFHVV